MGHDVDDADAHEGGQANGVAAIIGEDQECAAIRDQPTMQRNAVHCGGHGVLANAIKDIAPGAVFNGEAFGL